MACHLARWPKSVGTYSNSNLKRLVDLSTNMRKGHTFKKGTNVMCINRLQSFQGIQSCCILANTGHFISSITNALSPWLLQQNESHSLKSDSDSCCGGRLKKALLTCLIEGCHMGPFLNRTKLSATCCDMMWRCIFSSLYILSLLSVTHFYLNTKKIPIYPHNTIHNILQKKSCA